MPPGGSEFAKNYPPSPIPGRPDEIQPQFGLEGKPFGEQPRPDLEMAGRPLPPDEIRQIYGGTPFFQGPTQIGIQGNNQIREEMLRTQNQLNILNDEINIARNEIERLQKQLVALSETQKSVAVAQAHYNRMAQINLPPMPPPPSNPINSPIGPLPPINQPIINQPTGAAPPRMPIGGTPLPVSPTGVTDFNQLKERLNQVRLRLLNLLDQQKKLMERLNDLRNRLH